jgi:thymidine phosphorylase
MSNINDIIAAVAGNNMVDANNTFNSLMQDKLNSALDDVKIQMAQSMLVPDEELESEEPELEIEEDEDEDEDEEYEDD